MIYIKLSKNILFVGIQILFYYDFFDKIYYDCIGYYECIKWDLNILLCSKISILKFGIR